MTTMAKAMTWSIGPWCCPSRQARINRASDSTILRSRLIAGEQLGCGAPGPARHDSGELTLCG
jgi:hypothetical protein